VRAQRQVLRNANATIGRALREPILTVSQPEATLTLLLC